MSKSPISVVAALIANFSLVFSASAQSLDLDLSSANKSVEAKSDLFKGQTAVVIQKDGGTETITPGQWLTPAEFAALSQILAGQAQSLNLDASGRAVSGQLPLGAIGQPQLSSLLVPQNVTTLGGTISSTLNVSGALANYGSILALPTAQSFTINAGSVFNAPGAIISTVLPGASPAMNLNINTIGDVINHGTISSSAALNIFAGGAIQNVTQQASAQAVMSSVLNTTLNSAVGNIINSGLVTSASANINIQSATTSAMILNNLGGTLSAVNGAINVSHLNELLAQQTKLDLNVNGGSFVANAINFDSSGTINVDAHDLSGGVNVVGGAAHLLAQTGDLTLKSMNLTGDPSLVSVAGNVVIAGVGGTLTLHGQDLAVSAFGSVFADPALTNIDLSSTTGNGGNLFISAGMIPNQPNPAVDYYTLPQHADNGGQVALSGVSINTSTIANGAKAGNVTIAAHDDNDLNDGPNGTIQVGAVNASSANGTAGDVLIVAQSGPLNLTGTIDTQGGVAGGAIEFFGGEPVSLGLEFTGGTQTGKLGIAANVNHENVDVSLGPNAIAFVNPALPFDPKLVTSKITVNTSGDITLGDGLTLETGGVTTLRSRNGGIVDAGKLQIASLGDVGIEAYGFVSPISLGPNSRIVSGGSIDIETKNYGDLTLGNNASLFAAGGSNTLYSTWDLNFGDAVDITSIDGNVLAAYNDQNLNNNGSLFSIGSQILVAGNDINIGSNKQISSGLLNGTPTGLLTYDDINQFGGFYAIAENSVRNDSSITTNGLDLALIARNGTLDAGTNNQYTANGGDIALFAKGTLTGDGNTFKTTAIGENNAFFGGVVELSSGFSFSPFVLSTNGVSSQAHSFRAQLLATATNINTFIQTPDQPFTAPARDNTGLVTAGGLGTNVHIFDNGINVGLVLPTAGIASGGTGAIDVTGSTFDMKKGAVFLNAIGGDVNMTNSTFLVESYGVLPLTFTSLGNFSQFITDTLDGSETKPVQQRVLTVLLPRFEDTELINQAQYSRPNLFTIGFGNESRRDAQQRADSATATVVMTGHISKDRISSLGQLIDTGKTERMRVANIMNVTMNTARGAVSPLSITSGQVTSVPVRVSEQRSDLMLFTTAGQVMTQLGGNSDGSSVIGAKGTVVSSQDDKVVLHVGKVYATAGDEPMEVETDFGTVVVDKQTTAAIISEPGKPHRVVAFGNENAQITVRSRGEVGTVTVKSGEEASIELQPHDGNADQFRMVVMKQKPSVNELIDGERFASGNALRLGGTTRGAYQRLMENLSATAGHAVASRTGKTMAASELENAEIPSRFLAEDGTVVEQLEDGRVNVLFGQLLMSAHGKQTLTTNFGDIAVEDGAQVGVDSTDVRARVRAFSMNGARVKVGDRVVSLEPGQELLLQAQKPTKDESLPNDGIARRRLQQIHVAQGVEGVMGDFSIYSALASAPSLRKLRAPESDADRRLNYTLLKQAVALDMVTGKRGRYFVKPTETAYAP